MGHAGKACYFKIPGVTLIHTVTAGLTGCFSQLRVWPWRIWTCENIRWWHLEERVEGAKAWHGNTGKVYLASVTGMSNRPVFRSRWGPGLRGSEDVLLSAGPWMPMSVSVLAVPEQEYRFHQDLWNERRGYSLLCTKAQQSLSIYSFVFHDVGARHLYTKFSESVGHKSSV